MGASRGRLVRETVGEGLVLALIGGAFGVAAAVGALRWLVHVAPAGIPRIHEIGINVTVLLFSLAVAIACGVLFSLWPAWRGSRTDPQSALRSGGRSASDTGERMRVRSWLVGGQAALAALLLIVAGLLTASYVSLLGVNKGFQTGQVIEAELNWPGKRDQRAAFYRDVLAKMQVLPGVRIAGLIDTIPTQGVNDTDLLSYVHDPRPLVERPLAAFSSVSPDYFAAMDIPILRGRTFTGAEMARALAPVPKGATRPSIAAIISQTTADKMFPGKDPIGQQFMRSDPSETPFTIVGVVADVRANGLERTPGLAAYLPYTYNIPGAVALTLRTDDPLSSISGQIRQAVWSVRPDA
ncbi:MAG: ABC transporter permease, partial [Terriglobales bacterium]